jgi:hypothetical protein
MRDYTGWGPTQAHTTFTDSHVIVVLRDDPDIAVEMFILTPRRGAHDRAAEVAAGVAGAAEDAGG